MDVAHQGIFKEKVNDMKKYYELIFTKESKYDYDNYAFIGVYSKKIYAEIVKRKLIKSKRYFAKNKKYFIINTIRLDHNVEWEDGFIRYYYVD